MHLEPHFVLSKCPERERALKVSNKILKLILYLTGNQCKFIKTGVIWSYFLHDISSLAAAFCTLCNLAISQSGNP